jgi:hypothetical protein
MLNTHWGRITDQVFLPSAEFLGSCDGYFQSDEFGLFSEESQDASIFSACVAVFFHPKECVWSFYFDCSVYCKLLRFGFALDSHVFECRLMELEQPEFNGNFDDIYLELNKDGWTFFCGFIFYDERGDSVADFCASVRRVHAEHLCDIEIKNRERLAQKKILGRRCF